jgi:hypothetical protein
MNKLVILLLLFILRPVAAISQWKDDFRDGSFEGSDREVCWDGDKTEFRVNESFELQLNSSKDYSAVQLYVPSHQSGSMEWSFYVKMGFTPTSSNYAKVYLTSDERDLKGDLNGLYVRVGYSDKNISLIQSKKGSNNRTLISGGNNRLNESSVSVNIKATLDAKGFFNLYSKLEGEKDYVLEGSCEITENVTGEWFGVVCVFTSTRSKSFYFDDFTVSQEPSEDEPEPAYSTAKEGDIVFSEIMANPGATDIPEYVELYNTSEQALQLKDLLFFYDKTSYKLPEKIIYPHSYFLLCKTSSASWFGSEINVNGVTSFPTLANGGKLLKIENLQNELISWIEYSDNMYGENSKKSGGWSLEAIDLSNISNTDSNWSSSVDALGGTPGKVNSIRAVNPDVTQPSVVSSSMEEDNKIKINFSKPMNRRLLLDTQSYSISAEGIQIEELTANDPQGNELTVRLNRFPSRGDLIELSMQGVRDRTGNPLETSTLSVGLGFEAQANDVIINEILFNPPSGGNEYVELYNRSDKAIDLRYLSITSRKPSDGSFNTSYKLTDRAEFMYPGEYLVVTKNREQVCSYFTCREESRFVEPLSMPSLANTSGCAVILNNRTNEVVDQFYYNESMHSQSLKTKKGVALERIDIESSTDDSGNWASASATSGYGTPGYVNSQYGRLTGLAEKSGNTLTVDYSASQEGRYGFVYQLDKPDYRCRLFIYDASGRKIKNLAENELLGIRGELFWNGMGVNGQKQTSGIYLVYLELFDSAGNIRHLRSPVIIK